MSFGGLLGSLYGDLPAPKSSASAAVDSAAAISAPPAHSSDPPAAAKSQCASAFDHPNREKQASTAEDRSASLAWMNDRSRLMMLQPTNRKRDTSTRSSSSISDNPPKRIKDLLSDVQGPLASEASSDYGGCDVISSSTRQQFVPVTSEYDPAKPNSYDEYIKERARLARKQEEDARRLQELEELRENQKRATAVTATVSSNLNVTGEDAWRRRGQITQALFGTSVASAPSDPEKRGFAQKMLEKMGWKHGEGLGRDKQGILAPLVARKTDKRSGVIVQGVEKPKGRNNSSSHAAQQQQQPMPLPANSSRVVLLTNLVGKGEVDEDLESETAEEAAKYGNLLKVKIIELKALPDDQAVRIFCEYDSKDAAMKAINSFHGRLFGGRAVRAEFYPLESYTQGKLS